MDKKTIFIFVLSIFGLLSLMLWAKNIQVSRPERSNVKNVEKSSLIASEVLYNFGKISMKDGLVSHIFKITNPTKEDIEVKNLNTSCMCTKAYIKKLSGEKGPFGMPGMGYLPPADEVVKAGQSVDIKVVYDPNAHGPAGVGYIDRFVYLIEANKKTLRLEIKAVVTP